MRAQWSSNNGGSAHTTRSDEQERALLAGVARRERTDFEALYKLYHRPLERFLFRMSVSPDLAGEIINDTFYVVWSNASRFRGESRVSTWIMGIAYRRALKALQRSRSIAQLEDDEAFGTTDADDRSNVNRELEDWIFQGLNELPAEQRAAVELVYYFGHSLEEIGEIMGCRASTIKARMFHARARLRSVLSRLSGESAS
jgi:RNA polymerase sigma-70 factor (ECF subfamily)